VSLRFGVLHGWTSCTPHATKGAACCSLVVPRLHPCFGETWKIGCLLEELDDGYDDRVFLVKTLVTFFHIVAALTHHEYTGGCLPVGKTHKESIWKVEFIIIMIMIIF
jgi:hypothetical protein